MTLETFRFEIEVKKFEPGEKVRYEDEIHEVESWFAPLTSAEDATVILKGWKWGVEARYCEEVTDGK